MTDDERPLWRNPIELMNTLVTLAPELNVRVALLNVIEYMTDATSDTSVSDLMEIIAESLAKLHHHVGEPKDEDEDEIIARFRDELNGKDGE